jgi:hypothetical protein
MAFFQAKSPSFRGDACFFPDFERGEESFVTPLMAVGSSHSGSAGASRPTLLAKCKKSLNLSFHMTVNQNDDDSSGSPASSDEESSESSLDSDFEEFGEVLYEKHGSDDESLSTCSDGSQRQYAPGIDDITDTNNFSQEIGIQLTFHSGQAGLTKLENPSLSPLNRKVTKEVNEADPSEPKNPKRRSQSSDKETRRSRSADRMTGTTRTQTKRPTGHKDSGRSRSADNFKSGSRVDRLAKSEHGASRRPRRRLEALQSSFTKIDSFHSPESAGRPRPSIRRSTSCRNEQFTGNSDRPCPPVRSSSSEALPSSIKKSAGRTRPSIRRSASCRDEQCTGKSDRPHPPVRQLSSEALPSSIPKSPSRTRPSIRRSTSCRNEQLFTGDSDRPRPLVRQSSFSLKKTMLRLPGLSKAQSCRIVDGTLQNTNDSQPKDLMVGTGEKKISRRPSLARSLSSKFAQLAPKHQPFENEDEETVFSAHNDE